MTMLPEDELWALPLDIKPGITVLELGNKKNSTGLYRDWYTDQGLNYICLDWNGEDGALPLDMRHALTPGDIDIGFWEGFELVTNFGFTEHVEEQEQCWKNVHNFVGVGGHLAICMPMMPDWKGHGLWMPTVDWYFEFAELNGYNMGLRVWDRKRRTICARLRKNDEREFTMPTAEIVSSR